MTNEEFIESIKLDNEEWRDVVGYEGYYKVSNFARVISLGRTIKFFNSTKRTKPCFLKAIECCRNGKSYYIVNLSKFGTTKHVYLHRLVASAFLPNPNNYPEIDHIDRNGLNNSLDNIMWCTHKTNQNNPNTRKQMSLSQRGIKQPTKWIAVVKLLNNNIVKIYDNITSVRKDGHLPSGVVNVLKGKSKSHHGYNWMYLSEFKKSLVNQ